jgi:hypothetical protein
MDQIAQAISAMIKFDAGDPKRIHHFLKVHSFARLIALGEGVGGETLRRIELAAVVHDIGIHPAEEKYGCCDGKKQEQEGPLPAKALLIGVGVEEATADRIAFLVGHHHTYTGVDGLDWRILLEADFLVNAYEDELPQSAIAAGERNIFRTETGRNLLQTMYQL